MEIFGILFELIGYSLLIALFLFGGVFLLKAPFYIIGFISGIIGKLAKIDFGSSDTDSTPINSTKSNTYQSKDIYGIYSGTTRANDDLIEHYNEKGLTGISTKYGDDVYSYKPDGTYTGRTHISQENNKLTHYDKDNLIDGWSTIDDKGNITTYDRWGLPTGTTKKD